MACSFICAPLIVYIILTLIGVVVSISNHRRVSWSAWSIIFAILWGLLVAYLCSRCNTGWAWFVALFPIILSIVLVLLMVLVFGFVFVTGNRNPPLTPVNPPPLTRNFQ